MNIQQSNFGKTKDGQNVEQFTIKSSAGAVMKVISYGAIINELHIPDKSGKLADIVLGFDSLDPYFDKSPYFGATIGRVANRIANAKFTLDGKEYTLNANNGKHTLHGGPTGFSKRLWKAESLDDHRIRFSYISADGEEGFPGNLNVAVTMELNDHNELRIEYHATTDAPTPINLTNHSYFNLAGAGNGDILDHILTIHADHYTPVDETLIPTGEIAPVTGTPMDFTTPHKIGERIEQVKGGYDHNYVLIPGKTGEKIDCALLVDPKSGRSMQILTTEPGVQFYSGNFMDGQLKGIGGAYPRQGALCLETQHFPDAVNQPKFPSTILRPGDVYKQTTIYRFIS